VSYLLVVLLAVCGRIGTPGGNCFPSRLFDLGTHSDPDDPGTWRTVATGIPAIQGMFPPNVLPEEILSERPDRLRAVFAAASNPLRSYADTTAYEKAFGSLDLLVTADIAMTETAALSHYVLPAKSAYESWDSTFFGKTFPRVFFQMRRPVVRPEGDPKEVSEIFTLLARAMDLVPEAPEALRVAARNGATAEYRAALVEYVTENRNALPALPFVVAETLGAALGSANLASLFALLQTRNASAQDESAREGFAAGPEQGMELFRAIVDHPEGLWVGQCDSENNLGKLATPDGKIRLHVPELGAWLAEIDPAREEADLRPDDLYPFVLLAGRHMDMNANTNMRDPAWNEGRRPCTLLMNPEDASAHGFSDGQTVRVVTAAGEETIEVEVTNAARKGQVAMPHGFGLVHGGKKFGTNVNRLTASGHRDRIAATRFHRYVPCRVEAV
jgi:anaerobic selenocysteine-containing dehydrogenase